MTGAQERVGGAKLLKALKDVVAAWEALPGGDHRFYVVEQWLRSDMKPAIDRARAALKARSES